MGLTVSWAEEFRFSKAAVIIVNPNPLPVARPLVPKALLMVATEGSAELHVTNAVRHRALPSL
jgi:hypothetical protein